MKATVRLGSKRGKSPSPVMFFTCLEGNIGAVKTDKIGPDAPIYFDCT